MRKHGRLINLQELKARQAELSVMQTRLLPAIINEAKIAVVNSASRIFNKSSDPLKVFKINGKIDISGKFFCNLLPMIVTGTVFRRSGFLTKLMIGSAFRFLGKRVGPQIVNRLIKVVTAELNRKNKSAVYQFKTTF